MALGTIKQLPLAMILGLKIPIGIYRLVSDETLEKQVIEKPQKNFRLLQVYLERLGNLFQTI